jgi:starch synthase
VVGQGDHDLESSLLIAAERFAGRVAVRIAFDPVLSRRVYAGADFFFVPSRFEPCGLTQMYAMRYGAIPIVTDRGGLHDTVDPIDSMHYRGTGFVAAHADVPSLRAATLAALDLWRDRGLVAEASARGMAKDFSWNNPAREYQRLYAELVRPL